MNNINKFSDKNIENLTNTAFEKAIKSSIKINVFVFSYGGCGTNYLRRLLKIFTHNRYEPTSFKNIPNPKACIHIISPPKLPSYMTAIYIFGSPYLTIKSLFSNKNRYKIDTINILSGKKFIDDIKKHNLDFYLKNGTDSLRLIHHFNNWTQSKTKYKILYIKYETLQKNFDNIEKDFNIKFDEKIKRNYKQRDNLITNSFTKEQLKQLDSIYGHFNKKIENMPDYWMKYPNGKISIKPS